MVVSVYPIGQLCDAGLRGQPCLRIGSGTVAEAKWFRADFPDDLYREGPTLLSCSAKFAERFVPKLFTGLCDHHTDFGGCFEIGSHRFDCNVAQRVSDDSFFWWDGMVRFSSQSGHCDDRFGRVGNRGG